jgi:myo-inositol-1(or 4)-monophosphatase
VNIGSARELLAAALELATATIESLGEEGTEEVWGAGVTDISTRGDRAVSRALIDFFKKQEADLVLLSEESGRIELCPTPDCLVAFDDIDGTDNFFRGRDILPYCTVLSLFEGARPRYRDLLAAGIVEHRSGRTWMAGRGLGATVSTRGRGERAAASSKRESLDRRSLIVVDQYSARERAGELNLLAESAWLKDFGSSALHLAGVASGLFDGFVNLRHKAHELAAGYLLIREAGGCLLDLRGRPLDDEAYDFDATLGIVAAGTRELAMKIVERLGPARP